MKKLLRRLPMLLVLAAIVAGLVYGFRPQPVGVDLAVVERGPLELTVNQYGKTRVKQRYVVTAPLAGKLSRIDLKPGADLAKLVAAGRPLAVLEPAQPPLLDARARAEAQAREKAAEARLGEMKEKLDKARKLELHARSEFERVHRATLSGSASRQEEDDADLKLRSAARDLSAAQFAVYVAEFERDQVRATLRSFNPRTPMSPGEADPWRIDIPSPIGRGKVLRVFQESESVVAAGVQLLEVGDPEMIEAEIDLLTTDAVKVHDRAKAFLEHWGGKDPLVGEVRLTEPSGFMKVSALGVEEQRVNVIIDFKVPELYRGQVRDAYRVEARIIVWEGKNVLKVKSGALFRNEKKEWAVYVYQNGKAVAREVQIDNDNGIEAQVLGGLEEGEQVVLHPGDKIKPGIDIVSRKEQ